MGPLYFSRINCISNIIYAQPEICTTEHPLAYTVGCRVPSGTSLTPEQAKPQELIHTSWNRNILCLSFLEHNLEIHQNNPIPGSMHPRCNYIVRQTFSVSHQTRIYE
ncbi:hypothetical protein BDZ94DRAFT_1326153 [Collybia nuda]|uniref:Uncharacterized protein n=1 Tax=Collybia nuda TaxID=64659 RepID=A0A9P5XXU7_9AGAR|nr:hypothetical protein BDZ94DRAFT_1326153 [Collybia nuda]